MEVPSTRERNESTAVAFFSGLGKWSFPSDGKGNKKILNGQISELLRRY